MIYSALCPSEIKELHDAFRATGKHRKRSLTQGISGRKNFLCRFFLSFSFSLIQASRERNDRVASRARKELAGAGFNSFTAEQKQASRGAEGDGERSAISLLALNLAIFG